jgi:hypothetical protein
MVTSPHADPTQAARHAAVEFVHTFFPDSDAGARLSDHTENSSVRFSVFASFVLKLLGVNSFIVSSPV